MVSDQLNKNSAYFPVLFSITIAVFMCLLDSHIVRICLPIISREFDITSGQASWVNLAYLLVVTPGLPIFGKISDIVGAKRIFILGYIIFITGSILCGLSQSFYILVISRFIQGLGGAMLIASGPSMIPRYVPAEKRGFAFGLQASAAGLGISLGAPLGGVLTEMLSWRYIFYINIPVACIGILMAVKYLKPEPDVNYFKLLLKRLNIAGCFYLYFCLICLIGALSLVAKITAYPLSLFVLLALGFIFLILFMKTEKQANEPIIDTSLFSKSFMLIMISTFIGYIFMTGNTFMMPFYLMTALALTPVKSGLMILFFSLSFSFFSSVAGHRADKSDPKLLGSLGMLMTAATVTFFVFTIGNISVIQTAVFLFLYGFSFAFLVAPTNKLLISYIPKSKQGISNGIYRMVVFLASLVGLSIYGSFSDYAEVSNLITVYSNIYLWSISLPLASFMLLYFTKISPPAAD